MKNKKNQVLENCKNAIITGASSGLGLEFATELAKKKINLILIARRKEKLKQICLNLEKTYGITATYFPTDLSKNDEIISLFQEIPKNTPVDILVNCAGFGTLGNFSSVALESYSKMISVHINATVALSHFFLPKMQKQNRGIIINVASIAALVPSKGNTVYGGTKSFITTFSENLNLEIENPNIIIQALCPGLTKTEFHKVGHFSEFNPSTIPRKLWMSVNEVVSISLAKLKKNRVILIPGIKNRFIVKIARNFIGKAYIRYQKKKIKKKH